MWAALSPLARSSAAVFGGSWDSLIDGWRRVDS